VEILTGRADLLLAEPAIHRWKLPVIHEYLVPIERASDLSVIDFSKNQISFYLMEPIGLLYI
jgi:hypothetical protein